MIETDPSIPQPTPQSAQALSVGGLGVSSAREGASNRVLHAVFVMFQNYEHSLNENNAIVGEIADE